MISSITSAKNNIAKTNAKSDKSEKSEKIIKADAKETVAEKPKVVKKITKTGDIKVDAMIEKGLVKIPTKKAASKKQKPTIQGSKKNWMYYISTPYICAEGHGVYPCFFKTSEYELNMIKNHLSSLSTKKFITFDEHEDGSKCPLKINAEEMMKSFQALDILYTASHKKLIFSIMKVSMRLTPIQLLLKHLGRDYAIEPPSEVYAEGEVNDIKETVKDIAKQVENKNESGSEEEAEEEEEDQE